MQYSKQIVYSISNYSEFIKNKRSYYLLKEIIFYLESKESNYLKNQLKYILEEGKSQNKSYRTNEKPLINVINEEIKNKIFGLINLCEVKK